ncbi:MAG: hypothetical protein ACTS8W_05420 [Arsenophonus sp. NC-PY1-MAG3]
MQYMQNHTITVNTENHSFDTNNRTISHSQDPKERNDDSAIWY